MPTRVLQVPRASAGFSLLETLIALTLIATALLFTLAFTAQQARIDRHADAHVEVLDVLETLHERLRDGSAPAEGHTPINWYAVFDPQHYPQVAEDLSVTLDVERLPLDGLYRATLRARYSVAERPFERQVETLIWRP